MPTNDALVKGKNCPGIILIELFWGDEKRLAHLEFLVPVRVSTFNSVRECAVCMEFPGRSLVWDS